MLKSFSHYGCESLNFIMARRISHYSRVDYWVIQNSFFLLVHLTPLKGPFQSQVLELWFAPCRPDRWKLIQWARPANHTILKRGLLLIAEWHSPALAEKFFELIRRTALQLQKHPQLGSEHLHSEGIGHVCLKNVASKSFFLTCPLGIPRIGDRKWELT